LQERRFRTLEQINTLSHTGSQASVATKITAGIGSAEGSVAFQEMNDILEQLVEVGVEKTWSQSITKRLNKAKQYLKTNYKVNCQGKRQSVCGPLQAICFK
jgi:hypothetical protein